MEAQEKAKELVDKMLYCYQGHIDEYTAKQCALIAVDEILDASMLHFDEMSGYVIYWQQVKQELLKL
jgi:hypothetical protein